MLRFQNIKIFSQICFPSLVNRVKKEKKKVPLSEPDTLTPEVTEENGAQNTPKTVLTHSVEADSQFCIETSETVAFKKQVRNILARLASTLRQFLFSLH